MNHRIESYTTSAIRYLLLFAISGTLIYFFILENHEKAVVNQWFNTIQNTAFYGFDLLRNLLNTYLW